MKKSVVKYVTINAIIFLVMLYLSSLTALNGDDFRVQQYNGTGLIASISRAFEYTNDNYLHTNGRWWVVFLAAFMAQINKFIYNVVNASIFVFVINLIIFGFIKGRKTANWDDKCYLALLSFSMMWIFIPSVWDVYLWLSGSIGYLWTTAVLLWYGSYWYNSFLRFWKNDTEEILANKKQKGYTKVFRCIALSLGGWLPELRKNPAHAH